MSTDAITRAWMRNESDEKAAASGCRFDVLRGAWTVYWIERFCKLYEGEGYAGEPLILHGCRECDHSHLWATKEPWENDDGSPGPAQAIHLERARLFGECTKHGHHVDWQYDFFMRLTGWQRFNDRWRREIRRFKRSRCYVAKKNKKSPSLAALGLYLLCGDGEPGNNVYLGAKDGAQSREIAGKHTFEMLRQSEELKAECVANKSTMQILHEPSRSRLKPLSSANVRTKESKEGLNGSLLIDEEHVVDRDFINRVDRMGISRSEPLVSAFSTTGNNPDSYGKEGFDLALDVAAGKVEDEELLSAIYAAPQDLTQEQLEADFEKYARMANPSLGHTVELRELRGDYERSKSKIENLANCLMYRFNIWQHSSNPWLRPSDWAKCAVEFTEQDLLGQTCYGGLDLSLRWDTSAFALLFPIGAADDGQPRFRLWVYFFLPEKSAIKTKDKAAWFDWRSRKEITLTDGDTTDFPLIRRVINDARQKFDLQSIAYDDRFAETLAQELQDEDGLTMVDFNQTPQNFAEPMGLFESDVISGRIEHPNNRCLNWQAGNATKNIKGMLVKPELDDVKKIDGITAAVMARAMATTPQHEWFYLNNPVEMA